MSKFLRKFNNHVQYEVFTGTTTEFIKPNVSICVQESEVHYNPNSEIRVTGVTLDKDTMTINVKDITPLIATVLPEDATDKSVTWESSDSSIATVDENGNVSGIASGNVAITVTTVDGSYITQCEVTVKNYLVFVAEEDGTFSFTKTASTGNIQYKKNDDAWVTDTAVTVNAGDVVKWKGEMTPTQYWGIGQFSSTGNFIAAGNPMSLLFGDNYDGKTSLAGKHSAFRALFAACSGLTSAADLSPLATTLADNCCYAMFSGCTSLTSVPSNLLPATTMTNQCYNSMFYGCRSLTTAPDLPATTLEGYSYFKMFYGCYDLNYIKCLATNRTKAGCTEDWVTSVQTTSGTFIKAASASWTRGGSGIPNNWTVQDA